MPRTTDQDMKRWMRLVEQGPSITEVVSPKARQIITDCKDTLMGYVVGVCFAIEAFRRGKWQ